MSQELRQARVTPPGRILSRELEARGWSQRDLAEIMGRPVQAVNEIIQGKKQITPETALQLAQVFGTSPEFWTNLEANYQLHVAGQDNQGDDIARRSRLYTVAPIAELLKRKWIETSGSIDELERAVSTFLKIDSPLEKPTLAANFRRRGDSEMELNAAVAWLRRAEHLAEAQTVAGFDCDALRSAMSEVLTFAARAEDVGRVPPLLSKLGVHFVIAPHLSRTYLDGAAFFLESDGRPVVALSLRYDRIDAFWFTLLHELAHIVLEHPGTYLDDLYTDDGEALEVAEEAANQWARTWLLEQAKLMHFIAETRPFFSRVRVEAFARREGRHPGIVVGRLQYEKVVEFKQLRGLLVKVSPYLSDWIDSSGPRQAEANRDVA